MNFKYLDDLIHNGTKEIVLTSDIVLDDEEVSKYLDGIKLDVDGLTIDGDGHSIDACGKALIFYNTSRVTIKNITLRNGLGAIYNFRGVLNILNSALQANRAEVTGGAIYNYWGEVNILNSKFSQNSSDCHGGAIFNFNGVMNIVRSEFAYNEAKIDGGAIFNGSKLNIDECIFCANIANGSGGAVYDNRGEISIKDSRLSGNRSNGVFGGGAIHKNRGVLNINDSDFSSNSADCDGAAIFAIDCEMFLEKSTFRSNVSSGAAVHAKDINDLILKDCDFKNNLASDVFK